MTKKLFKRLSPDPVKIRANPALRFLGVLLHDPHLFHLNRHSVSIAVCIGLFVAFLPIPGQIPLVAFGALVLHCNLPISVALVWITNPLTFPFVLYAEYKLGAAILNIDEQNFAIEMSWQWLHSEFLMIWQPLLLGSIITSIFFAFFGYFAVQWSWRIHAINRWNERKILRKKKQGAHKYTNKDHS